MPTFDPAVDVILAALGAEVGVGRGGDEGDALARGQALDGGIADDHRDEIRALRGRHRERSPAVARERASFIEPGLAADQELAVAIFEPHGKHPRVAVQPVVAKLADDRAAKQLDRAGIYFFLSQSNGHKTKKTT